MYERIKNLREDKDLSQRVLAAALGMSQTGYSKYETGENDVPTVVLKALALYHNTSTDYILGLTDDAAPYRRNNTPAVYLSTAVPVGAKAGAR